jgi:hypothetical protein
MLISLQQICKSSLPDGMLLKSQSMDFDNIQSASFGEILKVEEKKQQQEQDVSALAVVAVLAAMQTPLIPKSAPSEIENSEKQSVSQAESIKLMTAQSLVNLLPNTVEKGQEKTAAEKKTAKVQVSTSMPVAELSQPAVGKVESSSTPVVITDTNIAIEKPSLPTAIPAEVASTQAVASAPSILSAPIGSDQEKTVVEAKPVDTQSQVVAPVEK